MTFAVSNSPLPILVVDDDSALIRTLSDILELHGYAPQTASSALEGLALAAHTSPALAVVDLRLPDMDGVELASRLHALSELTQVVVLTGNASVESAAAAMREQSIDYLVKPVQIDRLLQVVSMAGERWQRRLAEEKLRRSDERFRRVVESDMMGIMFWSMSGRIHDANDAFLRMLGYTRADLEADLLDWKTLSPPEFDEIDARMIAAIRADGLISPYEKEYFRRDGTRVPILIGAALIDEDCESGVAFVLDISDRRVAEQALASRTRQQEAVAAFGRRALSEVSVDALLENAVGLVAQTLNVPFVCVLARRSDRQSLSYSAHAGFGDVFDHLLRIPIHEQTIAGCTLLTEEPVMVEDLCAETRFPESSPLREYGIRGVISVPVPCGVQSYGVLQAFDVVERHFTKDDVHFLTAIAHVLGTSIDRHRIERGYRQSQRLEAVGRLASGVAHDFNNVLSAMTGYTELVLSDLAADDPHREDLQEVLRAGGRAARLTRQLLAFSREQVLQPRLLNLNDAVTGMAKMLERLMGPEITLTVRTDPDLVWVKADPGQIEQVLLNLCVNARDAMPHGGLLTIETANSRIDLADTPGFSHSLVQGECAMLAVTDTGIGMDADTRARIFEPFFTTKGPDKGTGLGLATVFGIVKQSAGEIFVYSEPGHGTSFKVFLPPCTTEAASHEVSTPRASATRRATETILIVDDDEAIRRVIQRSLERVGFEVLIATDGREALDFVESRGGDISVLVTDMIMPRMTGAELARRARELRPSLQVLFLSGFTGASMSAANTIGPEEHFLQKPFGSDTVAAKVRELLDAA